MNPHKTQTMQRRIRFSPCTDACPVSVAFTLVELLVVIAVIPILASILLPALGRAKAKTQGIACLSNLRQLQISWLCYCVDNTDAMPPNTPTSTQLGLRPDMGSTSNSWVAGNAWVDSTTENLRRGVLFPYSRSPGIYRCPADHSTVRDQGVLPRTRSYSMSWYANIWPAPDDCSWHKLGAICRPGPGHVFVFAEEHENSIQWGLFAVNHPNLYEHPGTKVWWWLSAPATRHCNSGALSFADGHAEIWRWQEAPSIKGPKASAWPDWRPAVPNSDRDLGRFFQAIPETVPIR